MYALEAKSPVLGTLAYVTPACFSDWPENQYKAPPGTDTYQIAIWSSIAMVLAAYGAARTVATIDYSGDTLLLCVDDSSAQDN